VAGIIRSIKKFSDLVGNRTLDLPAYSILPQLTTLPRAPCQKIYILEKWAGSKKIRKAMSMDNIWL
jgi:hypothetical protein